MRRFLKKFALVIVALVLITLIRNALEPEEARPDLDLNPAPTSTTNLAQPDSHSFAPVNPFLAKGVNPLPHGDTAQQDATPIPGPMGKTRRLSENELTYQFLGPGHFGIYTSSPYANGKRVLWTLSLIHI